MTGSGSVPPGSAEGSAADDGHEDGALAELGYKPELKRTLGNFHTFAAGISYISILTGTFQLFYFGVSHGGPAYWWSWPMVFVGQLMVALCFCELACRYPVAGSIYNWAKQLGGPHAGWLGGWMMLTASMVSLAAVALAYQVTLPQISSWFQFVGNGTGKTDAAANAVLLGTVLIAFTTLVNAFGVKLMARINSAGVAIELIAAIVLILLLAAHVTRGPATALTDTFGKGHGETLGYFGAFLTASLASAYVMYGFDTASSLGEESKDPTRNAPRAILRALIASFVIGGLILLFALLAVPDLHDERLSVDGLQYVVLATLGSTVGQIVLWCVVVAITVCELAVHTAAIRLAYAMARDNNLPASARLARVSPRFQTPVVPAVVIGVVGVAILLINVNQPQIFSVITSIAIIMIYLAYLMVTLPMLVQRLRGKWTPREGAFSLGRFGLPVNVLAVLWGLAMSLNLAWPRAAVYNATGPQHWYLRWGAFLFIGVVALGGFAYYWFVQRHRTGVLASHAAEGADSGDTAPAP
ncbi:amino acid/polyamine/organocation transporter, APC superfamily [Streptomyces yunnanensis]|uniref:Amino acid/polyamine/organocation transporter, APC superfamily n=1 Tax=Streptomyces yunnanensis TaxID=156453 RepID=A0A9X8N6N1_9ACTN|nr:amino acid permease [Streptomyces yunnanensis]SHN16725.1 amino acid/polyamine/organocation transporter, APC superfamily [Streptomyces yunnanensis]